MPRKPKQPFDMQSALGYLRNLGVNINAKTEDYVKRLYNRIRRQEAAGEPIDVRAAQGKSSVKHVPKNEERHTLGRWQFRGNSFESIAKFVKNSNKTRFSFVVTGIASSDSPGRKKQRDTTQPITLGTGGILRSAVESSIESIRKGGGLTGNNLIDLMNELGQLGMEWRSIDEVSIID